MKSAVLAVLTAALAGHAAAAIAKGVAYYTDGHSDQAVWLYGDSACDYVYMGPSDDNICAWNDGWFTAQNGYTYRFTGCGSSNFCILNADSSLNACGNWEPVTNAGSGCNGQAGSFHVDQEWVF